ncbi:MAG: HNH endonuclease [Rhodopila sp.]
MDEHHAHPRQRGGEDKVENLRLLCTDGVTTNTISRSATRRQRLEPYAGQLARTVLRGLGGGNVPRLPDR